MFRLINIRKNKGKGVEYSNYHIFGVDFIFCNVVKSLQYPIFAKQSI